MSSSSAVAEMIISIIVMIVVYYLLLLAIAVNPGFPCPLSVLGGSKEALRRWCSGFLGLELELNLGPAADAGPPWWC